MIPGMTLEKLQALTEPKLKLAKDFQTLTPPLAEAAKRIVCGLAPGQTSFS